MPVNYNYGGRYRTPRRFRRRSQNYKTILFVVLAFFLMAIILAGQRILTGPQGEHLIGRLWGTLTGSGEEQTPLVGMAITDRFRLLDQALVEVLADFQVTTGQVSQRQAWGKSPDGAWQPAIREIRVAPFYSLALCNLALSRAVRQVGGNIFDASETQDGQRLVMELGFPEGVTHRLLIRRDSRIARHTARVAIILDGLERASPAVLNGFEMLQRPFTFALDPWHDDAKALAQQVQTRGHEVILDLSLDTLAEKIPRADQPDQSEDQMRQTIASVLSSLPKARGAQIQFARPGALDSTLVTYLLEGLRSADMFYVAAESGLSPDLLVLANRLGVKSRIAWGRIDAEKDFAAIEGRLNQLCAAALYDQGPFVVLGQTQPATLAVLTDLMTRLELRGLILVRASEVFQ